MTTEQQKAAIANDLPNGAIVNKKPVRRTFTERLSDLSLEEKVAVIKELKAQVEQELANRKKSSEEAQALAQGL